MVDIEEKVKISDYFCCGLYGFKNTDSFIQLANELIELNLKTKQEFYFSQLKSYLQLLSTKMEKKFSIIIWTNAPLGIEASGKMAKYREKVKKNLKTESI